MLYGKTILVINESRNLLYMFLFLSCSLLPFNSKASAGSSLIPPCFGDGGIGSFDSSSDYNSWYKEAMDRGTISHEATEKYSGTYGLKVVVDTYSGWQVRIFNTSCFINFQADKSYLVEFWLRGDTGTEMAVTLMDGDQDPSQLFDVESAEWKKYSILLTPSVNQSEGKVRFNFKSPGTYYIDEITVIEADCNGDSGGSAEIDSCGICAGGNTGIIPGDLCERTWIKPSDPNLRYNGVVESIISDTAAILKRFKEDYINTADGFNPSKARTQSGISISFRTASPLIVMHFDTLSNSSQRTRNFAIFREGELIEDEITTLSFEIFNDGNEIHQYEVFLPSFSGVVFMGMELTSTSSLESLENDLTQPYVAIGNSITHGVGQSFGSHLTYPFYVADSLGYRLYNLGIGGSSINSDIISNIHSLPSPPKLISVLWGYNNAMFSSLDLSEAMTDYDTLITRLAREFPDTEIAGILQTFTTSTTGNNANNSIDRLRQDQLFILRERFLEFGNIRIIDGWELTSAIDLADAVHLSNDGAKSFANGLIRELKKTSPFAPPGAKWYYDERFAFSPNVDFIRFSSRGDTLLNGKNCSIIEKRHQLECYLRSQEEYLFSENNRVHFWDPGLNKFQVLYDFNARAGDQWSIRIMQGEMVNDSVIITVDSVNYTSINKHLLLTLHVIYEIYFEENSRSYNSLIMERIGDPAYLFNWYPYSSLACDANYSQGLRCYEDDSLGIYSSNIVTECDYVWTDVKNYEELESIIIYPNPTTGIVQVSSGQNHNFRITVFNYSGDEILQEQNKNSIDLSSFSPGIYFIKVRDEENRRKFLKIIRL